MNSISPTLLKQIALELTGLTTRTNNLAEQDINTQKIGPLWQQFFAERVPRLAEGELMYGVYYDYQSDMDGEFSVLVGSRAANEVDVSLAAGDYVKFSASGEMPQCVIGLWESVWQYFTSASCEYQRCYLTDYEVYLDANRVEIYIGINP
ncbi:GyrI-like domain-containing protein [Shewanella sp. VB17]|uniref:GyrI-like domain-containing protein n=1 Tax=Shewanella sp. VB17 TaxID=2739432 RepID=UPI0015657281|nr:GyrI-like domain-containing protein [Shewanella sp. VB17]NRD74740.1 GyrI-like domain-containing protein [Shewanella sp. VB17]